MDLRKVEENLVTLHVLRLYHKATLAFISTSVVLTVAAPEYYLHLPFLLIGMGTWLILARGILRLQKDTSQVHPRWFSSTKKFTPMNPWLTVLLPLTANYQVDRLDSALIELQESLTGEIYGYNGR